MRRVFVVGAGSISPAGPSSSDFSAALESKPGLFVLRECNGEELVMAPLCEASEAMLTKIRRANPAYESLDRSVLLALVASREAYARAGFAASDDLMINIGSSRGATELFERNFAGFIRNGKVPANSSPTTTLGNISSWVSHELGADGASISHSVTCSSALHAVANGLAWLRSGMASEALVGGAEAALTPFTMAQMRALRIYSNEKNTEFPCRPLLGKNSLVLGEGASVIALKASESVPDNAIAELLAVGLAVERLVSGAGISEEGEALRRSMERALEQAPGRVDALVLHAPGSAKGDAAELHALSTVFGDELPAITSTKWLFGHTFAASGGFSIEAALHMLKNSQLIHFPYAVSSAGKTAPRRIQRIMVNATGFGGNAVSVLLSCV